MHASLYTSMYKVYPYYMSIYTDYISMYIWIICYWEGNIWSGPCGGDVTENGCGNTFPKKKNNILLSPCTCFLEGISSEGRCKCGFLDQPLDCVF